MTLIELIAKHRTELSLSGEAFHGDRFAESMKLYEGFCNDLIVSPDFPFTVDEMEEVGRFLIDNGFQYQANAYIAGRVIRRKSFDSVTDTERRARLWLAFNRNPFETSSLKEAIEYAGREQVITDIKNINASFYRVINPELEKFSKRHMDVREKGEDSPELKFYEAIIERFYTGRVDCWGKAMNLRDSLEKEDYENRFKEALRRAREELGK